MAKKRVPPQTAQAIVARLLEGGDATELIDGQVGNELVTTVAIAARVDDTGAWARKQLAEWPRDVAFDAAQLARWNAERVREALVAHVVAFARLVAPLPFAAFQVREEFFRELLALVAERGALARYEEELAKVMATWADRGSVKRLAMHFERCAKTNAALTAVVALLTR